MASSDGSPAGLTDAFRIALEEEIEASKREASTSAVHLLSGRKIGQVGQAFQYRFGIETGLNMPGDAPGDLIVEGGKHNATVVSIDGFAITVSVPVDLGPFVGEAYLKSNLTYLLRKLVERIEDHGATENPAGDRLLGSAQPSGRPKRGAQASGLNPQQLDALASALGRDTTFIWGPPGTGKTRTIGAIAEVLYREGRSVLLVSHTNAAVDQALLQIGGALTEELESGRIVRVGTPKDNRLLQQPDLLLATHVERRQAELTAKQEALWEEREEQVEESLRLQREIALLEWLPEAKGDIKKMAEHLREVQRLDAQADGAQERLAELEEQASHWEEVLEDAEEADEAERSLARLERERENLQGHLGEVREQLEALEGDLGTAEAQLEAARRLEPLRAELDAYPSTTQQQQHVENCEEEVLKTDQHEWTAKLHLEEAEKLYAEAAAVGALTRRWRKLPNPEEQLQVVAELRQKTEQAVATNTEAKKALREAKVTYRRIVELTEELTPHESVPRLEAQQDHVTELQDRVRATTSEAEETERRLEENEKTTVELSEALRTFGEEYGRPPGAVLVEAKKHVQERGELPSLIRRLNGERRRLRKDLEGTLGDRLDAMREFDLTDTAPAEAEDMLEAIKAAHRKASEQLASKTIEVQQAALSRVNGRITQIDDELQEIEERLKSVEKTVIAEAAVVAATLTGAYLRDAIQERRFDTVILDEASMAPIPALWIAAALAEANVVVVGDFKQLPPIVLSRHELAKQWLGRDIFEVAGLPARHARGDAPSHFIPLRSQYRMHPEIRAIPNELFYDRYLTDGEGAGENTTLADWHREDWGYDAPVLLVDTGSTNAWVTSVPRGGARSSRLNFLSATICVDLAEALLREDRAPLEEGVDPRILIGCPYRPHARLLQLLLRDQSLDADVLAGTTHTFQGGEADLVILDLVNDEPHWRVGMCMPERDDNTKRLLNVALTRARARLIVVGDFDYIAKISKRAFMGREFLPFLNRHYPKVDALDLVPAGLAGRAARAQIVSSGGPVEADADRTVVTQDRFYPLVTSDLEAATDRVVIYSPFMTQNRVGELEPHLRAAVERGVEVYVVTKTQEERGKRDLETYRSMEGGLRSWGITVIHKRRMHEKLIFVDREVLWSGSLNPLSFRSSQEVMERRVSRTVVNDFAGTLRLDDLIAQYAQGETTCPICGSEVVPSEGRNEPFYWRCVAKDCYSRSIDDPPLQDGFLRCRSCNGPLRFGEWGNDWVWRCEENYRHRQPIARTHLKLPEMRSLIPEADLLELERRFGID